MKGTVTLLFSVQDMKHNIAVVLSDAISKKAKRKS